MVFITVDAWRKNSAEVIIVDDIKWLNKTNIKKQLKHPNLREATSKYPLYLRKQRQELQDCSKQQCKRFLREDFAVQIVMDCKTIPAVNVRNRLGFQQQEPIMTQEQSVFKSEKYLQLEK